jgi:hypothetical protein
MEEKEEKNFVLLVVFVVRKKDTRFLGWLFYLIDFSINPVVLRLD